ncbi:RIP metalloprotease [Blastococcus sp. Marseille-P5729]|uniref:M50 family metallopeptidase n=1 Tax=Blastococcus sp. Marseille-P5729 TaxID=2086582 RepID=UPI000D0FAC00|nr:site-2 protease family protein [Blastococcus sp. Marseille-P5729]
MLTAIGILLFVVGLLFSIWWHELGHFLAAKRFGMRVSQFMVGFGPTMWSRQVGETEHGIKWIPLGGYIRIIGMIPPPPPDRPQGKGPFAGLIREVREQSAAELQPGDENRTFFSKPWWQRAITMIAGPIQNLILAFVLFAIILTTFGVHTPSLTVQTVSECVLPSTTNAKDCTKPVDEDGRLCENGTDGCALPPASPAAEAGFRAGDTITEMNGQAVASWDAVRAEIRRSPEKSMTFTVERQGDSIELSVTPMRNTVRSDDDPDRTVEVGYLGLAPTTPMTTMPITEVPSYVGNFIVLATERIIQLPERVPQLVRATFAGAQRDPEGPVGIVGVGRLSGEIFALPQPAQERIAYLLSLLASLNMVLFLFNLVPIYPLDGGHIAGAFYEGLRNAIYRIRGKTPPGPIDIAKVMPVAYVVAGIFVLFSGLLLVADVINPITLNQ